MNASDLITLNAQIVGTVAGANVTRGQLAAAFDAVQNRDNWKNPVDATLSAADVAALGGAEVIAEAVVFFAGCRPKFTATADGSVRVTARGYFAAVGA